MKKKRETTDWVPIEEFFEEQEKLNNTENPFSEQYKPAVDVQSLLDMSEELIEVVGEELDELFGQTLSNYRASRWGEGEFVDPEVALSAAVDSIREFREHFRFIEEKFESLTKAYRLEKEGLEEQIRKLGREPEKVYYPRREIIEDPEDDLPY